MAMKCSEILVQSMIEFCHLIETPVGLGFFLEAKLLLKLQKYRADLARFDIFQGKTTASNSISLNSEWGKKGKKDEKRLLCFLFTGYNYPRLVLTVISLKWPLKMVAKFAKVNQRSSDMLDKYWHSFIFFFLGTSFH